MKIDKVSIIIENLDEERASVRLVTDPQPDPEDEIEDTPAVTLGSMIWDVVQQFLEEGEGEFSKGETLQ